MDDIAIIENKIYEIRGQKVMLDFDSVSYTHLRAHETGT